MVKRLSSTDQNQNTLVNVPTPTNSGDAVNKSYADTKVAETTLTQNLPTTVGTNGQVLKSNGTAVTWQADTNTTYTEITEAEITAGTASTLRTITGRRSQFIVNKAQTGVVKSTTTNRVTVSISEPSSPAEGDIWIDLG